jgi:hypothetical protein
MIIIPILRATQTTVAQNFTFKTTIIPKLKENGTKNTEWMDGWVKLTCNNSQKGEINDALTHTE